MRMATTYLWCRIRSLVSWVTVASLVCTWVLTAAAGDEQRLVAGMYVPGYKDQAANLDAVSGWAGQRLTLAGTFIDVKDAANVQVRLEQAWIARTTPFVNVETRGTARDIASGAYDDAIGAFAAAVRRWLDLGDGRSVIVAPLPEMNLAEHPWGCDPLHGRAAYLRFVQLFAGAGIDDPTRVRWAFAPNGWTAAACGGSSEPYYPGAASVDLVGISAYNFGPRSWDGRSQSPREVYEPWLQQVRAYAPHAPILIAQTGTSPDGGDRAAWIHEMFAYLSAAPNVVGFIYFNFDKSSAGGNELDWRVFDVSRPAVAVSPADGASAPSPITPPFARGGDEEAPGDVLPSPPGGLRITPPPQAPRADVARPRFVNEAAFRAGMQSGLVRYEWPLRSWFREGPLRAPQ
jgi:hypothetical protein